MPTDSEDVRLSGSEFGTSRTCRGGPKTSALEGRTDIPVKRADFRVLPNPDTGRAQRLRPDPTILRELPRRYLIRSRIAQAFRGVCAMRRREFTAGVLMFAAMRPAR